jgi:cysteine desulfurase
MTPYFSTVFGNPNSLHEYGKDSLAALEKSRLSVAKLINSEADEIVFTSGSTESNRIAIERTALADGRNFVTARTEHKSVLDCSESLAARGIKVRFLNIESNGLIDFANLKDTLSGAGLLSICMVNNETGVLQNIRRISEVCGEHNILVHTDATQAFGKIPINVKELGIDFLSASGHKIYGPKGVGILFCKNRKKRYVKVLNANHEVEFGIRSGTVPVPLCVGMGVASDIAGRKMTSDLARISKLSMSFISGLLSQLDEIYINGAPDSNYPGIVNVSFRGCEGEAMMMECPELAISSGSACTSNKLSISHVLAGMNTPPDIAQSSLRISIGRNTTPSEIDVAIKSLVRATEKLREISPIWDMIVAGVDIRSMFGDKRACEV